MTEPAGRLDAPPEIQAYIGGQWRRAASMRDVVDPYRGAVASRAADCGADEVAEAVAAASEAARRGPAPGFERRDWLRAAACLTRDRAEAIAFAITRETGKPIADTRVEVARAADTLDLSADEAVRIAGEHIPLDASPLGAGKLAMLLRYPVGVVGAIVPFNAPFNMACHKVGPALAAGNAVVLKGPPEAPGALAMLADLLDEAGVPAGWLSILPGGAEAGEALVADPRVGFITFTGSTRAGEAIRCAAGMRRVTLELGGLGPNIVCADADIETAARLCAANGTRLAGQSCVSVQNLFVDRAILPAFTEHMVAAVAAVETGDPCDPDTAVGPMISEDAAVRVESWVAEAVEQGARLLVGGGREGAVMAPTLLADVRPEMRVACEEIFGPVIVLRGFERIDEPIDWVNESPFGLQCGLFTDSTTIAMDVARRLSCGGLIVNGTSTFRPDQSPYGGVRMSGLGREGPAQAVADMTEERLLVFNI